MNNIDVPEFAKIMAAMGVTYDKEISEELTNIYYEVLKEFSLTDIKRAMSIHLKESKFFPKPSEIIERIKSPETIEMKADKAWNQLLKATSKHGYYDSVEFIDKVIHSCIRAMGGWLLISDREPDTWMHKDFVNFYKSYYNSPNHTERICGWMEKNGGQFNVAKIGDTITLGKYEPNGMPGLSVRGINRIGNVLSLPKKQVG